MMADAIFDHDRLDVYRLANRLDVDADGDEDRRGIMRGSITITSTASLSTSTNLRPKKRQNHGMQVRGGGEVSREIIVNFRPP